MDSKTQFRTILYGGCAVLFSVFLLLYLIPTQVQTSESYELNPASFPQIAAYIIGLSGLALVITTLIAIPDRKAMLTVFKDGLQWKLILKQVGFVTAMVVYIQMIPVIGFAIASSLFSFGMLFYFGSRSVVKNLIISIAFSLVSYLLFTRLFQVSLHAGFLPF